LEDFFLEAKKVYEEIENQFEIHTDVLCNILATYVRVEDITNLKKSIEKYKSKLNSSFECIYNIGTAYLESGDLTKAKEYLQQAQEICETSLSENGFSQEDIQGELGIIKAQLAYIEQRKGESTKALKMLEEIYESKTGLAVKAVCSNNIVTLREGDKFDSLKNYKN